ncbi:FAD-binding oxidoreductase [Sediminimonas sp.]|uniref:NAD(P)/FAD-dependent oxidoreductase n=1 Tax=Sediminimonas sp. TaxID=2823379 RepID=UPI0025F54B4C|nr:FAD-binding oxidoreductase [Sediminimonas sp.]
MTGQTEKTVAIVGAGIVGVATALWLLRAGHRVILVDKAGPGEGASLGNGGILASCAVVPVSGPGLIAKAPRMLLDPRQPLFVRWRDMPGMVPWLWRFMGNANANDTRRIAAALAPLVGDSLADHQALAAGTAAERYIVPGDYLYIYRDRREFEAEAFSWDIRRAHGFTWEEMGPDRLHAYDPAISRDMRFAVRLPGHGRITDPGAYVRALAAEAEARGARLVRAEVSEVLREGGGRVRGLPAGGEVIACDDVVVCAGAWSGRLARALGLRVPLQAERGYHVELWNPSQTLSAPAMVSAGKFVLNPMEGRLRLAGVVELASRDAPPARAPFRLLMRGLRAVLPDLRWDEASEWMGSRPSTPDSLPLIGAVPGLAGAWAGFGHQHVGLTAGPATGRLLAQMIAGQRPNVDVAPYDPGRFA